MTRIRAWRRWHDLRGAISAAALMCRVAVGLRRLSFPDLLDRLDLREPRQVAPPDCVERARTDVRRAHRLLPLAPNCLLDSLTAATLIRRQGYSVPLAIGVKSEQGEVLAHAWLGAEGAGGAEGFRLLYRVPNED